MGGEQQNGIGVDEREDRQIAPEHAEKPWLARLMATPSKTGAASQNLWTRCAPTRQAARAGPHFSHTSIAKRARDP